MEGNVYGFRVKGVKVTNGAEVTEMAEKAKGSKGIWMTARHVIQPVAKNGVRITARHVICPVAEMPEMPDMTIRHVMQGLGKVAV